MLPPSEFSHNEDAYIPDPFAFYRRMRAERPAFLSERIFAGTWLVFRYEDCHELILEDRLSNARAALPLWFLPPDQRAAFGDMVSVFERWLAFHDGASHTTLRRQANHGYLPFSEERLEPRIQRVVDGLIDRVDPAGFDLMSEFAFPLPAMVIADVLGLPLDRHPDLTRWTDDIAHLFGSTEVDTAHVVRTRESTRELVEFLSSREAAEASRAQDGLLHQLRTVEVHGYRFSDADVVSQAALLLFAGVASIRYLIGNSVQALDGLPRPELRLLNDPDRAGDAVEELLRFCTPVQFVGRVAREDFTYRVTDGTEADIRAGQAVLLYVASANRDPAQFTDPERLMLDRPAPNRHLTFGAGRHICFGDPLVRQTTRIALATIYRRMPALQVLPQEFDFNNNLGFHGFQALQVAAV